MSNQGTNPRISMCVSSHDAQIALSQIQHDVCQQGITTRWHTYRDKNGNEQARAQSICWLYCWAATGMGSDRALRQAREAFDSIFYRSYNWLEQRLSLDVARQFRYKSLARDIEQDFDNSIT